MCVCLLSCCFVRAKLKQIRQETNESSTYAPGPCHVHVIVSCNKPKTLLDRLQQLQQMKILNTECLMELVLLYLISKTPTILSFLWIWFPNMMVQIPSTAHFTELFLITSLQQNLPL